MTRLLTNKEYAQPVVPVDGDGNIITGTGGASTVADGADVTLGAKADAAVGDASGTVNAHLRSSRVPASTSP
jgi:hypothetical protein